MTQIYRHERYFLFTAKLSSLKHLFQPLLPPRKRAVVVYLVIETEAVVQEVDGLVHGAGIGNDGEQGGVRGYGKGTADTHQVVAVVSYQRVAGLARHHVHHRGTGLLQHAHQLVGVFVVGDAVKEVAPVREEKGLVHTLQYEIGHAVVAVAQLEDVLHVVLAVHQGEVATQVEGGTGGGLDKGTHEMNFWDADFADERGLTTRTYIRHYFIGRPIVLPVAGKLGSPMGLICFPLQEGCR